MEHLRGGITCRDSDAGAASATCIRALYSMHALDPEAVGGVITGIDEERTEGMRRLAQRLDEQGYLAKDMTRAKAAHILWVVTSFDSFDALYTGRGLSAARCGALLAELAERAVTTPG